MAKLTDRQVRALGAGRYGDGAGLWLYVNEAGGKSWVLRYSYDGKRRETGLGGYPIVSLAAARDKAIDMRRAIAAGADPIATKKAEAAAEAKVPTFGEMADMLIASKGPEWRNDKHKQQWVMTLTRYCAPIRPKPVDQITTDDVLSVVKPIWAKTPETASRLRGRIEAVLDAAKAKGHRTGENPAAWRGHLSHLLPKRQKLSRGHHAAMNYADVPAFIYELRKSSSTAAMALEWTILTAARSGETLGAVFEEIDFENALWIVPAERMKAGVEHRVPLCARAVEIARQLYEMRRSQYVFPGQTNKRSKINKNARPLSNMSMEMLLRRMGVDDATVHGFRSSFRDYLGNETNTAREVAEGCLAHTIQGVEAAYRRDNALAKRRTAMNEWAAFCESATDNNGNITHQ